MLDYLVIGEAGPSTTIGTMIVVSGAFSNFNASNQEIRLGSYH